MTFPTVTHLRSWASARRTARLLHSIQQKYIGCEVVETMPNGSQWAGYIESMEWDASLVALDEDGNVCSGAWTVYVRYSDNDGKFGSWTTCDVLRLTGEKK